MKPWTRATLGAVLAVSATVATVAAQHQHAPGSRRVTMEDLHRGGGVPQQPGVKLRVEPCSGDDVRAVAGADAGFVGLDQCIQCGGIDVTLVDEHTFQGPHAQVHLTDLAVVGRIVAVSVTARHAHVPDVTTMPHVAQPSARRARLLLQYCDHKSHERSLSSTCSIS